MSSFRKKSPLANSLGLAKKIHAGTKRTLNKLSPAFEKKKGRTAATSNERLSARHAQSASSSPSCAQTMYTHAHKHTTPLKH